MLAKQVELDFHEKELVGQLLTGHTCKAVCKGTTCPCKNSPSSTGA